MKELLQEAKALQEQIVADRRYLHQIPEVGMDLPSRQLTSRSACGKWALSPSLRRDGRGGAPEVHQDGFPRHEASTGVVATIGSGSPCILLRADFDALPMEETNGLSFCSKRSCSHMCGHDTHAAMLLGAAKLLKDHESELKGTSSSCSSPARRWATAPRP